MHRKMSPRCEHVGKNATWATENIITQLYSFIDRNIILNTDAIAYLYPVADIYILPKRTVTTNTDTSLYMAKMPHFGTMAYLDILIDITAGVYVHVVYHPNGCGVRGCFAIGW